MTDDPLIGKQLANYRLERILGRGGMAQVYYGTDVKLQRPVAVKVIDARFRDNPAYAERFVREARAVATWRHENIAQIYYADEEGDLYYFAMEYIDGVDLGQLLSQFVAKDELMPQADVLRIGWAIASALDYAHTKNVIHRDVKPSNVLIARDGRVVLTDFGLAMDVQQGSVGEVFGSAHYIAPEQARQSSKAVPQSDLYSLAILLYEMLTGMVPFDDPSPTSVALQHITQPPPAPRTLNPDLSKEVEDVLLKSLSKPPQDRYATGAEFLNALEDAFKTDITADRSIPLPPPPAGMSVPSTPAPAPPPIDKAPSVTKPKTTSPQPQRSPTLWWGLGGCAIVLVFGLVIAGLWFSRLSQNAASFTTTEINPALTSPALPVDVQSTDSSVAVQSTESPTLSTAVSEPIVKYPNGKHFKILYDNNSLYLLNLSESTISIRLISFERLSNDDTPSNRFDGTGWAKFYEDSLPNRCDAIRILDSPPYLDPPVCGDNYFLSLVTPVRANPYVFWTTLEGSHEFRVLSRKDGNDEEVARCEISAGICEVYLP